MAFAGKRLGLAASCFAVTVLAGCATAPGGGASVAPQTSPLKLCKGFTVRNAPATDKAGRVANFSPYIKVRGKRLASAPVRGCLTTGFGDRHRRIDLPNRLHEGIDIAPGGKVPVGAGGTGVVSAVTSARGYGRYVDIDHGNGVVTRYAHLSSVSANVRPGRRVNAGSAIGRAGASGNASGVHFHYEIRVDGRAINPLQSR
ncbi:MAG: M23 family metallopeptidase [Pseudomonadota bacterium]